MDEINLEFQMAQPINHILIGDMPIKLLELSEEVLSQVQNVWSSGGIGGNVLPDYPILPELCCFCWTPPDPPIPEPLHSGNKGRDVQDWVKG